LSKNGFKMGTAALKVFEEDFVRFDDEFGAHIPYFIGFSINAKEKFIAFRSPVNNIVILEQT